MLCNRQRQVTLGQFLLLRTALNELQFAAEPMPARYARLTLTPARTPCPTRGQPEMIDEQPGGASAADGRALRQIDRGF